MELSNPQLLNYVGRIKLTPDMKRKYTDQIDNLITTVSVAIKSQTKLKVTKVLRAGSWKKGTALRPRSEHPLDADLVFFLNGTEDAAPDIAGLNATLLELLLAAYPTKKAADFKAGEKTVNLVFRGTGLKVDLVPVVPLAHEAEYVWQPTTTPSPVVVVTSVVGQLDFSARRKEANPSYTAIVRMLKAWKAHNELELSSFAVELLVAHLDLTVGVQSGIEAAVVRFFEFLARDQRIAVSFNAAAGRVPNPAPDPYLADPTHNENNVLERTSPAEWAEVVVAAETAWSTLTYAQAKATMGDTVALWKEVFSRYFNIEEES